MNTNSQTNNNLSITQYQRYLRIDMKYRQGANNHQKSINRTKLTTLIVVRFGIIAPVIIRSLYGISQHQALEHLNKLVREGLLQIVKTHRSTDGRVYVPTYAAAKFAEELMCIEVYFRSQSNPALQFNHNNVMHNLINMYVMLKGLNNRNTNGPAEQLWNGFVTEPEFKRLANKTIRAVDGLVQEPDGTVICTEIEHSFKKKGTRQIILLKYLDALKKGYYSKIFIFSQSKLIFDDIKRLHEQLFVELCTRYDKKSKQPLLSAADAELLKSSIIYRTKFCDDLQKLFYP